MPYHITEYIETPNPNALKCLLSASPAGPAGMRSYTRSRPDPAPGEGDPLGLALMAIPELESVLIHDGWITVVKAGSAGWPGVKRSVVAALAAIPSGAGSGPA